MSSATAPLRYRPFRLLVTGRVINVFGGSMAPIALAFAVLDLTGSVSDLGLVVGARSVVNVIFILFGGVVADRLPRQAVIVVSNSLAFLTQALVATLVLTHHATVASLAIIGAINGMVSAFAFPASSALMAQTVPADIRRQANAINRLGINAASISGASLGSLIIALTSPGLGIAIDSATYLIAAALFALIRVPSVKLERTVRPSTLHELRVGWREFSSRTWLWVVVVGFCFYNMAEVAGMGVLGPAVADDTFGRKAWGLVLASATVGNVVGALFAMRVKVRRLLLLGVICCAVQPLVLIALGVSPVIVILIPVAFVAGASIEQFGVAWETTMQDNIPADRLARVYSYDALGSWIAIPLGQVLAGPLAEHVGPPTALVIFAGVGLASVVFMVASRSVRTIEHGSAAPSPTTIEPQPLPAALQTVPAALPVVPDVAPEGVVG